MLLFLAIIVLIVFGAMGFVTHMFWLGLIAAAALAVAHVATGGLHGQT